MQHQKARQSIKDMHKPRSSSSSRDDTLGRIWGRQQEVHGNRQRKEDYPVLLLKHDVDVEHLKSIFVGLNDSSLRRNAHACIVGEENDCSLITSYPCRLVVWMIPPIIRFFVIDITDVKRGGTFLC